MNLIEEAEALILYQFASSSKLKALLRCLIRPLQEILDIIESLHHGEYIKKAQGHRLDILGEIVGQPRRDMLDEDYRAWIQVGIKLNNGIGTAEDIFSIFGLLYKKPSLRLHEYKPNDVVFTILTQSKAQNTTLFDIIKCAVPVTTQCYFIRADVPSPFTFDVTSFEQAMWAEFY